MHHGSHEARFVATRVRRKAAADPAPGDDVASAAGPDAEAPAPAAPARKPRKKKADALVENGAAAGPPQATTTPLEGGAAPESTAAPAEPPKPKRKKKATPAAEPEPAPAPAADALSAEDTMRFSGEASTSSAAPVPPATPRRSAPNVARVRSEIQAQEAEDAWTPRSAAGDLAGASPPGGGGEAPGEPALPSPSWMAGRAPSPRLDANGERMRGRPLKSWAAQPADASGEDASEPKLLGALNKAGGRQEGLGGVLAAWQPHAAPDALRPDIWDRKELTMAPDMKPRNEFEQKYMEEQLAQNEWFRKREHAYLIAHRGWLKQHDQGPTVVNRYAMVRRIAGEMSRFEANDYARGPLSPGLISSYARAEIVCDEDFPQYNKWLKQNIESILKRWPEEMHADETGRMDDVVFLVPREDAKEDDRQMDQAMSDDALASLFLDNILPNVSLSNLGADTNFAAEIYSGGPDAPADGTPAKRGRKKKNAGVVVDEDLLGSIREPEQESAGQGLRQEDDEDVEDVEGVMEPEEE